MSAKTTIEIAADDLLTIVGALDYQYNGLFKEYDLEEKGVRSAPVTVQQLIDKLTDLAETLEEKAAVALSSEK